MHLLFQGFDSLYTTFMPSYEVTEQTPIWSVEKRVFNIVLPKNGMNGLSLTSTLNIFWKKGNIMHVSEER